MISGIGQVIRQRSLGSRAFEQEFVGFLKVFRLRKFLAAVMLIFVKENLVKPRTTVSAGLLPPHLRSSDDPDRNLKLKNVLKRAVERDHAPKTLIDSILKGIR